MVSHLKLTSVTHCALFAALTVLILGCADTKPVSINVPEIDQIVAPEETLQEDDTPALELQPVSTTTTEEASHRLDSDVIDVSHQRNPFQPPNLEVEKVVAKTSDAKIQFLGIAGTSSEKIALLKYNSELIRVKENATYEDIYVIQITNNTVELQKGKRKWTLSLYQ